MIAPIPSGPRVAYVMSRFPRLTETFILYEILALERRGLDVAVYPLMRERKTRVHPDGASPLAKAVDLMSAESGEVVMHEEARALLPRVHYSGLMSWSIAGAVISALVRRPAAFVATLSSIVIRNLGSLNYLLGGLAIFPKAVYLASEMRRTGITHVHAHFANHPTTAAYVIRRLGGIEYSFTGHGADLQVDQHMLAEKVERAAFVRAIAEDGRAFIARHASAAAADKIVVVPCGVDTDAFAGAERADPAPGPVRVLCVATMYEVKGHRFLFEAIAQLVERGVQVRCRLAGDGPDRAVLEAMVSRLRITEQVEFLGQRTREQVVALMHESDVLVVPSIPTSSGRREGLPVVIIEAMAAGLPVIASEISGIPEIVLDGRTGLLVPPRDPQAIAAAIERLMTDHQLRRQMTDAAGVLARERYDLDVVSERLVALFTSTSAAA